ncbi:cation channel sperm-associated protein 2-like [Colossoma macropomum]|uniref:cation channel sperm-associated protein 2-like n=1 Tax=Colossoma macropomum TaxID=42526 RepID=UPI001864B7AB|nr:cation channel sperm-associated protein 2-like [Colossoma macropomum]
MDTQEFQSAPYYQQERAKTFFRRVEMIRAKLVKEAYYQLEQQQKRSTEVKIDVEEQEGGEFSPQAQTAIAIDVSLWERLKRRVLKLPSTSAFARRILENQYFTGLIIFFIVLNTVLMGVQAEISNKPHLHLANQVLNSINWLVVAVFYVEIVLKWMDDFCQFWRNAWNVFDFFLTFLSVLPEIIMAFGGTTVKAPGIVKVLRTLRVLRALKITSKLRQIRLTLLAITKSFKDLIPVFLLLLIVMYIFALAGIPVFKEHTHSDIQNLTYTKSFAGISNSFSTVFILLTNDHWYALLEDGWKVPEVNKISCGAFVIIWLIIGSFIFRNLFVGFMVSSFQAIRTDFVKEVQLIEIQQKANSFKADLIYRTMSRTTIKEESPASSSHHPPDEIDVDWETKVMEYLDVVKEQEETEQVVWPRDTLFRYYELMEELQRNLEEKKRLHHLKIQALLSLHDM